MKSTLKKFASRKFLICLIGTILGAFIYIVLGDSAVSQISGAAVSLGSVMTYIITEGRIDAYSAKEIVDIICNSILNEVEEEK